MTNYAYLDENNIVVAVTVGKDKNESIDGLDPETYYALGTPYRVKEIVEGGIGYFYDENNDVFIAPQPYPSWILNSDFDWEAPKQKPSDGLWTWDEDSLGWISDSQS